MAKTNGKTNGAVAVVKTNAMQAFDPSRFEASAENMSRVGASAGRSEFLRMDKQGDWYFGVNDTPVDPDERVYVDPMGSVHGWQCWADTDRPDVKAPELLGHQIVPGHEPLPPKPDETYKTGKGWSTMAGLSMLLNGHKLAFTTTSLGGLDAVAAISNAQRAQYRIDPARMVAVVNLTSDYYMHKKWGKTWVPVFSIIDWVAAPPADAGDTVASTASKAIDKAKTKPAAPTAKPPLRRPFKAPAKPGPQPRR